MIIWDQSVKEVFVYKPAGRGSISNKGGGDGGKISANKNLLTLILQSHSIALHLSFKLPSLAVAGHIET